VAQQLGLPRRLGKGSAAIPLALGAMVGAGLFVGPAPAAAVGGGWLLLLGIPIAAVTALCCALATAELSSIYRGPGSAYTCVRSQVGVMPARISASTYLVGQIAAMAAVARAIGQYLPTQSAKGVAAVVVLLAVLGSTAGLRVRGVASWLPLGFAFAVLVIVVAACFAITPVAAAPMVAPMPHSADGITGAAGTMFFAYLGFERLGAPAVDRDRYEHRDLLRGLIISIGAMTLMALITSAALLYQLGAARLALSPAPMTDALNAAAATNLGPMIGAGVALAMTPILLGALESFRSTSRALIHDGDLPLVLGRTRRGGTPYLLDLSAGIAAAVLALVLQPAQAIGLAACCVLVHYAFASVGARLLLADGRTRQMRILCAGMVLCVLLAMSMPVFAMVTTLLVALAGPVLAGLFSGRWR
jgi:basic amino acid/polyamine antiporter, APA family